MFVVLAVVCFALAALLGVMATRPRKTLRLVRAIWRPANAWKYAKTELYDRYEPSDAYCVVASLVWGVVAVGSVGFGIFFVVVAITGNPVDNAHERREEARANCLAVMDELEDVFTDVEHLDPVRSTARELGVRIEVDTVPVGTGDIEPLTLVRVIQGDETLGTLGSTAGPDACATIGY